jgi:hypothetical protein
LNVTGLVGRCPSLSERLDGGLPPVEAVEACVRELDVQNVVTYQPGTRFWAFQFMESGILVAVAAVAIGLSFLAVQRRNS